MRQGSKPKQDDEGKKDNGEQDDKQNGVEYVKPELIPYKDWPDWMEGAFQNINFQLDTKKGRGVVEPQVFALDDLYRVDGGFGPPHRLTCEMRLFGGGVSRVVNQPVYIAKCKELGPVGQFTPGQGGRRRQTGDVTRVRVLCEAEKGDLPFRPSLRSTREHNLMAAPTPVNPLTQAEVLKIWKCENEEELEKVFNTEGFDRNKRWGRNFSELKETWAEFRRHISEQKDANQEGTGVYFYHPIVPTPGSTWNTVLALCSDVANKVIMPDGTPLFEEQPPVVVGGGATAEQAPVSPLANALEAERQEAAAGARGEQPRGREVTPES